MLPPINDLDLLNQGFRFEPEDKEDFEPSKRMYNLYLNEEKGASIIEFKEEGKVVYNLIIGHKVKYSGPIRDKHFLAQLLINLELIG